MKFTPELLVSAPRRTAGTPNQSGTHVLYNISSYSVKDKTGQNAVRVLDLSTGRSNLFSDAAIEDPQWLNASSVIWRKSKDAETELWIGNAIDEDKNAYKVGSIEAEVDEIKYKHLEDGSVAVVFTAFVNDKGELLKSPSKSDYGSSGREYEDTRVRFWDKYYGKERSSIWYTTLNKNAETAKFELSEEKAVNTLAESGLEFPWCDNSLGGAGNFEISDAGLLISSPDPQHDRTFRITSETYFIPLSTLKDGKPSLRQLGVPHLTGSSTECSFSSDNTLVTFIKARDWRGEEGRSRSVIVYSLPDDKVVAEIDLVMENIDGQEVDVCPASLLFSTDSTELYMTAQWQGRNPLFSIPVKIGSESAQKITPKLLSGENSVFSASLLKKDSKSDSNLFVVMASFIDSSEYAILNPSTGSLKSVSSVTEYGKLFGLSKEQFSSCWAQSDTGHKIQFWMMKPSNFDPSKKYPVVFMVHGGPQGQWTNSWSTRWNPAVFAEQGYIAIGPNITGSTGFGEKFTAGANGQWGGAPYDDLVTIFDHLEKEYSFTDMNRVVAAGGSYGGYMMNWLAGQPLGKKFKALACHNGIFSFSNLYSADVTFDGAFYLGGEIWDNLEAYDRNDPARFTMNWTQPMLFIHSDNDFRCPITEGMAAFRVCLQRKIPTRYLTFPDENHWVLKKANSLHWHRTVLGWFNKYAEVEGGVVLGEPVTGNSGWKY